MFEGITFEDADEPDELPELPATPPKAADRVWLISMSCCSWFIENICPTIAVGSMGEVGS